jgi:acetyltransferase-like isoleucine patch superfamily enzyme
MIPVLADSLPARWFFEVVRRCYQLRYPRRLSIAPGVRIWGRLTIGGSVRVRIEAGCRIRQRVIINGKGTVTVGRHTLLNGCWIGARRSITIGDWCLISDCAISDTDFHNLPPRLRHRPATEQATAPITIERNVWVGARAIVGKGVTIGADSVVGTGAVVRTDVPSGVVVIGNPAQVVKTFTERTAPEEDLRVGTD